MKPRTHTTWRTYIRPGETVEVKNGTLIKNHSPVAIRIEIQVPISQESQNGQPKQKPA